MVTDEGLVQTLCFVLVFFVGVRFMKKVGYGIIFVLLMVSCQTVYATSGRLSDDSIVTCNGITYGQHKGHWHVAKKNNGPGYSAVGSEMYYNPCSGGSSESTNDSGSTYQTAPQQSPVVVEPVKSSDNSLKEILINGSAITIQNNIQYETEEETLTLKVTTTDAKATATYESEYDLNIGMNKIEIKVTAEDGTEKIYQINVQRNKKKSNNTNIKKLLLNQMEVTFDNDKGHVVLDETIKNKQDIKMQCTVEDANAKCEMDQWEKKDDTHSTLTIYVTAEDGIVRYYTIQIEVEETSAGAVLLFVVFWLIALAFALYYYYKKNKPEVIEKWKEKLTKKDSKH